MKSLLKLFKRIISFIFKSNVPEHVVVVEKTVYRDVGNVTNIYVNPPPPQNQNDRRDD